MAQKELTSTISISVSIQGALLVSEYIWADRGKIQQYLDELSTIVIGGTNDTEANYSEGTAKGMENDQVYEVIVYLACAYEISTISVSPILAVVVAKMTAAQIGMSRFASSLGNDLSDWTLRLKNEAWSTLQRLVVLQTLTGDNILPKEVSLQDRLIFAKTRERAVVQNV